MVEHDNRNCNLEVRAPRHLSSHSWSVADSPSKALLAKTRCQEVSSFKLREPENTGHISTEGTHSLSDNYPTNIRSGHSQNADFVENVVIIETGLSKISLPELQRKWSQGGPLLRIFYEQFNKAEPEQ
ncbi:hypothetical protein ACTXT7_010426 [Hymenolepis weldensis]